MTTDAGIPLISVLMPVYNAGLYVQEAILSIIEQEFSDFELLVFNDGSTDDSSAVIRAINDPRIRFFDSAQNKGYVAHLNEGLQLARGKYIARMDADDIALPARFARQVALLDANPELGLCGTAYDTFGGQAISVKVPVSDREIREFMLAHSPMGHPTVMFRKAIVEQYGLRYDREFMPAEDYKLWYDFSKVSKIQNLPDVLLHYRVHPHQISAYLNETQRTHADRVRVLQLAEKGIPLTPAEQHTYCQVLTGTARPQTAAELEELLALMWKVCRENARLQAYDSAWFTERFASAWRDAVNSLQEYTPAQLRPIILRNKPMPDPIGYSAKAKLLVKGLLYWKVKAQPQVFSLMLQL